MKFEKIGDATVSKIALGTSGSGSYSTATTSNIKSRIQLYNEAIELGINFFDTAELYGGGFAEEVLGKAILNKRKDVFIASKFNPNHSSCKSILNAVESSLKRLKTDYIDLCQMHWPNPGIDYTEVITAIDRLLKEGKIKYFGLSNYSYPELIDIKRNLGTISITAIENQYNLARKEIENDVLPFCVRNNITVLAYSPLGQGKLIDIISNNKFIEKLRYQYDITTSQLLLNWLSSKKNVIPVVRTGNADHLKENIKALDIKCQLSESEKLNGLINIEIKNIAIKNIIIENKNGRKVYKNASEAISNKFDWIPSPNLLAERIKKYEVAEPINLIKYNNQDKETLYKVDAYDFLGENKKYWGWILANGESSEIPYISSDSFKIIP